MAATYYFLVYFLFSAPADLTCDAPHTKRDGNEIFSWIAGELELELELIQTQMAQKPMLRGEVGMRVRCANKGSAE
jgi:hypothetical protein